jgi:hypothetical protein
MLRAGESLMQIYWLLRTMAHDTRRKGDKVVPSLLQACEQAATAPKVPPAPPQARERAPDSTAVPDGPRLRALRRHTTSVVIPSAGPCEGLSQFSDEAERSAPDVAAPDRTPQSGDGGPSDTARSDEERDDDDPDSRRLSEMHAELGAGEGVTQLVRASLAQLSGGGTGVVSTSAPVDTGAADGAGATEVFRATVDFFDRLCSSSSTLVPVATHRRQSTLRSRLEAINTRLHEPALVGKARTPGRGCCVQCHLRSLCACPASVLLLHNTP